MTGSGVVMPPAALSRRSALGSTPIVRGDEQSGAAAGGWLVSRSDSKRSCLTAS